MTNMHDLSGWIEVSCAERDRLWVESSEQVVASSSLTDPDGIFGDPIIYTEWAVSNGGPFLRDYIKRGESCSHYVREGTDVPVD